VALTLATRERRVVVVGSVLLALVGLYLFVVEPLLHRSADLDRLIEQKRREQAEVVRLADEYRQARARLDELQAQLSRAGRDFQLLSFLEGLTVRNGVRDRIAYMRPGQAAAVGRFREQTVEMRLERVTINDLTKFLVQLGEAPQGLRVKRLSVTRRFDDANRLDVVMQVAAYQLA
jgi:general secretion pathway protein M